MEDWVEEGWDGGLGRGRVGWRIGSGSVEEVGGAF